MWTEDSRRKTQQAESMKACVLHHQADATQRPLRHVDMPNPSPDAGKALIRIRACGVCRTDLHIVEGELPLRNSPIIPGHQVVGEIAQLPKMPQSPESGLPLRLGDRVGVAWLHGACGKCRFCRSDRENLCDRAEFTGWTRDGGYAEYIAAPLDFIYRLPSEEVMSDVQVAPLLCAGIIGYRCLRLTEIGDWRGAKLGIYGFGAAGHIAIQIARARGADVYVFTRDRDRHQQLANELGAAWVGDTFDPTPQGVKLDASIIFAPAGEIVPAALQSLDKAGRLVLGGIHMSTIPQLEYQWLYHERVIRSVANNTRRDGVEFLDEAARVGIRTSVRTFPLAQANDALIALKQDAIKGAAVLTI
jgi:propanol-preferring alcohol dehydrogenase